MRLQSQGAKIWNKCESRGELVEELVSGVERTRMDHLSAMLQCDLDDLVTGQISTDRSVLASLANDICLIGLCRQIISAISLSTTQGVVSRGQGVRQIEMGLRSFPSLDPVGAIRVS